MDYIFDASSAILLFEKCGLRKHLLKFSKSNRLYVPLRVYKEYSEGKSVAKSDTDAFKKVFCVVDSPLEEVLLPYFNFRTSSGEIWVISHALKNPECWCVIDEEFGRNIAALFDRKLTGAIGIIREMKKQEVLSENELRLLAEKVKRSRFYLSKSLLKELDTICSSHHA